MWIYKDYTKKPDMIQQIPSKELDAIKEWLDRCDNEICCREFDTAIVASTYTTPKVSSRSIGRRL